MIDVDTNTTDSLMVFRNYINTTTSMTKQQLDNEIELPQLKLETLLDFKALRSEEALPSKFRIFPLLPTKLQLKIRKYALFRPKIWLWRPMSAVKELWSCTTSLWTPLCIQTLLATLTSSGYMQTLSQDRNRCLIPPFSFETQGPIAIHRTIRMDFDIDMIVLLGFDQFGILH